MAKDTVPGLRFVKPKNAPKGREFDLGGSDLNMLQWTVGLALVIPGLLDEDKLLHAIELALERYPHMATAVKRKGDDIKLVVTDDSAISFSCEDDLETSGFREKADEKYFGMPYYATYARFLPDYFMCDLAKLEEATPLFGMRVTRLHKCQKTVIGTCMVHVVGDMRTYMAFMTTISDIYQGLKPTLPLPVYHLPPIEEIQEHVKATPPQQTDGPLEIPPAPTPSAVETPAPGSQVNLINWTLPKVFVEKLCEMSASDEANAPPVSRACVLFAYVSDLLGKLYGQPFKTIHTVMDYRLKEVDENQLYRHPDRAGNCLYFSELPIPSGNVKEMAQILTKNLRHEMSTEAIENNILNSDAPQRHAVLKEGRYLDYVPPSDSLLINSRTKFKVHSIVHFGQKGKIQVYGDVCDERIVHIDAMNPTEDSEGVWNMHEGEVSVAFGIPAELEAAANALFEKDLKEICGQTVA